MKLYPHQIDGLKATEGMNHVAYYWDMGLGKTFEGSEKMVQLGAKVNLIVCQKSKLQDWTDHMEDNYLIPIFKLTDKENMREFMWLSNDVSFGRCIGIIKS